METEEFNTDVFIDEIEKRPAIWDMHSKLYSNKTAKKSAWEELVLIFCKSDDTEEKKKILGSSLQKKWKSLRDKYVRELKKHTLKSGAGASKQSTYIYFNRLTFLRTTITKNDTDSNFDNDVDVAFKPPDSQQCRKKIKLHPADEYFANMIERNLNNKPNVGEEDEDKHFCLSLYREIKKVPANMRLKLKIDIYNLILGRQSTQQQALPQMSNAVYPVEPSTSKSYSQASLGQQYSMPHSVYQPNSYFNTSYDTPSYTQLHSHQTFANSVQGQAVTPVPTPSPSASTNVSENSHDSSELDLFVNTVTR